MVACGFTILSDLFKGMLHLVFAKDTVSLNAEQPAWALSLLGTESWQIQNQPFPREEVVAR